MERLLYNPESVRLKNLPIGQSNGPLQKRTDKLQPRICQARVSRACEMRSGLLELFRVHRTTRYCRDCSPIVRRRRSAEWKRKKRRELGWRAYRDEYSTYVDQAQERNYHREYMRDWRAGVRRRQGSLVPASSGQVDSATSEDSTVARESRLPQNTARALCLVG